MRVQRFHPKRSRRGPHRCNADATPLGNFGTPELVVELNIFASGYDHAMLPDDQLEAFIRWHKPHLRFLTTLNREHILDSQLLTVTGLSGSSNHLLHSHGSRR